MSGSSVAMIGSASATVAQDPTIRKPGSVCNNRLRLSRNRPRSSTNRIRISCAIGLFQVTGWRKRKFDHKNSAMRLGFIVQVPAEGSQQGTGEIDAEAGGLRSGLE